MNRIELAARRALKSLLSLLDAGYSRPGPLILIYHQVGAGLRREMEVTEAAFGAQMTHLAAHEQVLSLPEALAAPARRSVVLTFDDGYRDTAETAFPIMRDLGLPFTLYLATESLETGKPLGPPEGSEPASWAQVESMAASGLVTIGSHTHSHADLRRLDRDSIERELTISDDLIERRLGIASQHFAYPWGYWAEHAHDLVSERYRTAVLGGGAPVTPETDPRRLNRVPVQLSDGTLGFRAKLRHGGRSEERLRRAVRGYRGP